ncbi:MAG: hypothetical protein ABF449_07620 [Ethanoligenens sp.]|uniref:RDAC family protein n=1 Tax=Ethanoligenens sp. TaxID=2099655 RepID=UPI0039E90374
MSTLSLLDVPKLKELVRPYGYNIHMHDACGGQSFTLERTGEKASADVYGAIETFFAARHMTVRFYDDAKLNFVVQ